MIGRYKHETMSKLVPQHCSQGTHEIGPLHILLLVFYLLSYVRSEDFEDVHVAVLVHERPWDIKQGSLGLYLDLREGG